MVTERIRAYEVEENDFIPASENKPEARVFSFEDTGDLIVFDLVDEDGEHYNFAREPFHWVEIITSFDDPEIEEDDS